MELIYAVTKILTLHYIDLPSYIALMGTCRSMRYTTPALLTPVDEEALRELGSRRNWILARLVFRWCIGGGQLDAPRRWALQQAVQVMTRPGDLAAIPELRGGLEMLRVAFTRVGSLILYGDEEAWCEDVFRWGGTDALLALTECTDWHVPVSYAYRVDAILLEHLHRYRVDDLDILAAVLLTTRQALPAHAARGLINRQPAAIAALAYARPAECRNIVKEFFSHGDGVPRWVVYRYIYRLRCVDHYVQFALSAARGNLNEVAEVLRGVGLNARLAIVRIMIGYELMNPGDLRVILETLPKTRWLAPVFHETPPRTFGGWKNGKRNTGNNATYR